MKLFPPEFPLRILGSELLLSPSDLFALQRPGLHLGGCPQIRRHGKPVSGARSPSGDRLADAGSAKGVSRGLKFPFGLNRLNVETSQARCVCIPTNGPKLLETERLTPGKVQLMNVLCGYKELVTVGDHEKP